MSNAAAAFAVMKDRIGEEQGAGNWFTVSQDQIDRFADVTNDHQFIHVDPERAVAETPFGGTIAHGFLTLSMLVHLQESIETEPMPLDGLMMGQSRLSKHGQRKKLMGPEADPGVIEWTEGEPA